MTIYFRTTERLVLDDDDLARALPSFIEHKAYLKGEFNEELPFEDTVEGLKKYFQTSDANEFIEQIARSTFYHDVESIDYDVNVYNH